MLFSRVIFRSLPCFISLRHWHRNIKMPPPDRWGDYCPVGAVIEGTSIFCCKVPLKHGLVKCLPEEERFTPENLIETLQQKEKALGLIIDLTFTRKYYNSSEFTSKGIQYEKIFTKGHEVPTDQVYGRFASVVDQFIDKSQCETSVVGVHCTHGVNRTGYLVCRYLIEKHSMPPDEAITAFNTARGHNLERENYLEDLKTRSPGEVTPFDPSAPMEDEKDERQGGGSRIRMPKSSRDVENSYSKLKEQHMPRGQWSRQQQRDYHMRQPRGAWNNGESNSNWRGRGEHSRFNEDYRDDWQRRGNFQPRGRAGGYNGDSNDNGRYNSGNRNPSNRDGGRYRSNEDNYTYDYNYTNQSNGMCDYNEEPRNDSYGRNSYRGGANSQDYEYSGQFTNSRNFRNEQNRGNYNSGNYRDNSDKYRSPMRYADWSEQKSSNGWGQARGQGYDRGHEGLGKPRRGGRGNRR